MPVILEGLRNVVRRLRADPLSCLSSECVLALGAFLYGVKHANAAVAPLIVELAEAIPGPYEGDACTKAYVSHRNTREAMDAVLGALERLLEAAPEPALTDKPTLGIDTPIGWLRDALAQGRPGMVVLEPRILWFGDYLNGWLAGLSLLDAAKAEIDRLSVRAFEQWLRRDAMKAGLAPWPALVHAFGGTSENGLRRFIEWWDRWRATGP